MTATEFLVASGIAFWVLQGVFWGAILTVTVRKARQSQPTGPAKKIPATTARKCITDIENYLRTETER